MLGAWVSNQRLAKVKGALSPDRVQRLDELGFVWSPNEVLWEQWFSCLKAYKEEHGDCLVVAGSKHDGFPLGKWVSHQRGRKASGTLAPDRVQRLDELGFVWDALAANWEQGFNCLKAYKEEHGDCLVSKRLGTANGFALGVWVSNQRARNGKGVLSPDRVQRLDELGFVWDAKKG